MDEQVTVNKTYYQTRVSHYIKYYKYYKETSLLNCETFLTQAVESKEKHLVSFCLKKLIYS